MMEPKFNSSRAWMTIENTTAGRSHGKLEPMRNQEGFGVATWAFTAFCLSLAGLLGYGVWVALPS